MGASNLLQIMESGNPKHAALHSDDRELESTRASESADGDTLRGGS